MFTKQLQQVRALARRGAKLFGQLSALADLAGLDVLDQVFKVFAVAFALLGFLLNFVIFKVRRLAVRVVRRFRVGVTRAVTDGSAAALRRLSATWEYCISLLKPDN